jgi:hypothetical protein
MLQEVSGDDGVEDFIERFDGGVVEMVEFEDERSGQDQDENSGREPGIHARSFQT